MTNYDKGMVNHIKAMMEAAEKNGIKTILLTDEKQLEPISFVCEN